VNGKIEFHGSVSEQVREIFRTLREYAAGRSRAGLMSIFHFEGSVTR